MKQLSRQNEKVRRARLLNILPSWGFTPGSPQSTFWDYPRKDKNMRNALDTSWHIGRNICTFSINTTEFALKLKVHHLRNMWKHRISIEPRYTEMNLQHDPTRTVSTPGCRQVEPEADFPHKWIQSSMDIVAYGSLDRATFEARSFQSWGNLQEETRNSGKFTMI